MDVRRSQVRVLGEDLVGRHPVRDHRHDRGDREAQPPDARQPAHDSGVGGDAFEGHVFMLAASGVVVQTAPYAVVAARLILAKAGRVSRTLSRLRREPRSRREAAGGVEVGWRRRAERRSASSGALDAHVPFVRIALSCDGARQTRPGTYLSMVCLEITESSRSQSARALVGRASRGSGQY